VPDSWRLMRRELFADAHFAVSLVDDDHHSMRIRFRHSVGPRYYARRTGRADCDRRDDSATVDAVARAS
jgi:hypothetical protein